MSTKYHEIGAHKKDNWNVWHSGTVSARENRSVEFTPEISGVIDWGLLYAVRQHKNDHLA